MRRRLVSFPKESFLTEQQSPKMINLILHVIKQEQLVVCLEQKQMRTARENSVT